MMKSNDVLDSMQGHLSAVKVVADGGGSVKEMQAVGVSGAANALWTIALLLAEIRDELAALPKAGI